MLTVILPTGRVVVMSKSIAFAVLVARLLVYGMMILVPVRLWGPWLGGILASLICGLAGTLMEWPFLYLLLWAGLVEDAPAKPEPEGE